MCLLTDQNVLLQSQNIFKKLKMAGKFCQDQIKLHHLSSTFSSIQLKIVIPKAPQKFG